MDMIFRLLISALFLIAWSGILYDAGYRKGLWDAEHKEKP